ncbi:MAG: C10 family peptidase [Prevotella sp.]|uniref:C10 family peptidase n=1 Tax=Prevotella sp. TaxID=59823 RepID=UPI002A2E8E53|nr:C10 family peptidase [Prevotella sp.]MDD7318623.1 C10 family peptidase [Prevotellaceae bacterium]MDY4019421.1 C10 family peptidase [Prevotella sp.]
MLNIKKAGLFFMLVLMCAVTASAKPRTKAEMKSLAKQAINAHLVKQHRAPRMGEVIELKSQKATVVLGYKEGGYAVVSNDDLLPEVLGYSDTKFDMATSNENLKWWLEAMDEAARIIVAKGQPRKIVAPDPSKYEAAVAPMCTTKWGQAVPYNNCCPPGKDTGAGDGHDYGNDTDRCVVGCVATAMAQVLAYNKYPTTGIGTHSVEVEQEGGKKKTFTVNFEEAFYDYDNMLNKYIEGQYTEEQGRAVALLSYHCGVASDMSYGINGSGAYTDKAAEGLRRNFGIETATFYDRNNSGKTEKEWMDLIFNELSNGRPLMYGGGSYYGWQMVGHEFVFDGYDETGKVSVNWGWNGEGDGFYDVSLLDVDGYEWKYQQDMVIGISSGETVELLNKDITLEQAGTMGSIIPADDRLKTGELKVKGDINSSDLKLLREMAGVDSEGNKTKGRLFSLDLSEARIVAGGVPYLIEDGNSYTTANDELPYKAFYMASKLRTLKLPKTINKVGDGALAMLSGLKDLTLANASDVQEYKVEGNAILSKDGTELIAVTPVAVGEYVIPNTVTKVHAFALAGCAKLNKVRVPATVESLGKEAMNGCKSLVELRSESRTVPAAGVMAFDGIDENMCKLVIPSGTKTLYARAQGWKKFINVKEYGTTIKPSNISRKYGEPNPTNFSYQLLGDYVTGKPEIYTDATQTSPAGTYPIHAKPGTITAPDVTYEDGYMIITKVPLTVTVEDATRKQYEKDPEFVLHFEGFVNGEDESVITTMPTVTSNATYDSPEGEYVLTISGGEAQNYKFNYVSGKLVISGVGEITNGIGTITISDKEPRDIYNVHGQLVRRAATSVVGLPTGLYIIEGKKVVVK